MVARGLQALEEREQAVLFFGFVGRERKPSSALWECGNRAVCDFQGRWKEWETAVWFSTLSTARHFHSAAVVVESLPSC